MAFFYNAEESQEREKSPSEIVWPDIIKSSEESSVSWELVKVGHGQNINKVEQLVHRDSGLQFPVSTERLLKQDGSYEEFCS